MMRRTTTQMALAAFLARGCGEGALMERSRNRQLDARFFELR